MRTRKSVVHPSDEAMAEKMHYCGEQLPPEVSELVHAGLMTAPCTPVAPPRAAEAPAGAACLACLLRLQAS